VNERIQTQVESAQKSSSLAPSRPGLLQRKCACGGTPGVDGECAECRKKRLGLQPKATNQSAPATAPPVVHETLRSSGQPLEANTRDFMESRFGHDFSRVRIHADTQAQESARAVDALAYTVGQHVVFGRGQYAPGTASGKKLLAHELAHVMQQSSESGASNNGALGRVPISGPSDDSERAAEGVAENMARGASLAQRSLRSLPGAGGLVQRQVAPEREDEVAPSDGAMGPEGMAVGAGVTGAPIRSRCAVGLGCPLIATCSGGRVCALSDCGTGACRGCPPEYANLIIRAWCSYRCLPAGSAFILFTRPFNVEIGPICLD
jgi:Domain of unknown function (DUF4157)